MSESIQGIFYCLNLFVYRDTPIADKLLLQTRNQKQL